MVITNGPHLTLLWRKIGIIRVRNQIRCILLVTYEY